MPLCLCVEVLTVDMHTQTRCETQCVRVSLCLCVSFPSQSNTDYEPPAATKFHMLLLLLVCKTALRVQASVLQCCMYQIR